jgi:DNA-binding CsgD family transcriptional regulator
MPASLCIQVSSSLQPEKTKLEFMQSEMWTHQSEQALLQRLSELLTLIRKDGISLCVHLDVVVTNPSDVVFTLRKKLSQHNENTVGDYKLSVREVEVLALIMQGLTNQQIAEQLFISFETVRSHRKNILEKTGAKNTAALINYYHQTFFEK